MKSNRSNRLNRNAGAVLFWAGVLLTTSACGQNRVSSPLKLTIIQGQQFAHSVHLPSDFQRTSQDRGASLPYPLGRFDHYAFWLLASSPDVLIVAACRYDRSDVEVCSANSFAIDTAHSYTVRETTQRDWDQATPIEGFLEMDDPVHRTLKEELAKPAELRALPIGTGAEREGYRYGGKAYLRRAKWITALCFGASLDRKLIVLAGYDRNKLSHGPFTLDVFDSDPTRRVATLDAESPTWVEGRLREVSIVNSRWLVVGLDLNLRDMLLFDFKPATGAPTK